MVSSAKFSAMCLSLGSVIPDDLSHGVRGSPFPYDALSLQEETGVSIWRAGHSFDFRNLKTLLSDTVTLFHSHPTVYRSV
jgi:hypothetical protein